MTRFEDMTKKEKEEFLSMDLIERMIRLEQRVSASFGEFIPYPKTHYFQNLSQNEKSKFTKYLKKYKRRKYILGFLLSLFVVTVFLFKGNITGNFISNTLFSFNTIYGKIFSISLLLIVLLSIFILLFKNKKEKKFKSHSNVMYNLYLRKIRK